MDPAVAQLWLAQQSWTYLAERLVLGYVVLRFILGTLVPLLTSAEYRRGLVAAAIKFLRKNVPGAAGAVAKEQQKILDDIERNVVGKDAVTERVEKFREIPAKGLSIDKLTEIIGVLKSGEAQYASRKAFGGIYHEEGLKVSKATMLAYQSFTYTNALYPSLFPGLRKFEAEVVRMSAAMLCGDDEVCGTMTTGGTESLIMAMKSYRDRAAALFGITAPEIVIPATAHPALNKGAHLLGVKLVIVPVDATFRADMAAFARALNANTVMAVGSAPAFPHGTMDPIEEMAALCAARRIGFHVDCCLGGFLMPWLKRLGALPGNFDFSIQGVTSISADLHKYGNSHKGASVVLYRSKDLRKYQYFCATSWPGGLYCSPSFAGSRSGGCIAAAWAALVANGQDGFMAAAASMQRAFERTVAGIRAVPGLRVIGDPVASIVAFTSDEFSVLQLADEMTARGWDLSRLVMPTCVHWAIGERQVELVDAMLADIAECAQICRAHPERAKEGMAGIYGMAGTLPDRTIVDDILTGYMDVLLKA